MIAAFFDFDGTLFTGRIWQTLVHHLWAARCQRRWVAAYVARNLAPFPLYKLGLMSQDEFYRAWGETMSWMIRGWTENEAQTLFEHLTGEQILPSLRADVLDRLRQHQEQGHLVALVSGTFAPWLEAIARQLDVPHAIGTPLEMRGGRFIGRIIPPLCQGPGKPSRIKTYLTERSLEIDWATSFAYGDSGPDIHLLAQVGNPVAVYPDKTLLACAQAKGWPVIGGAQE